MAWDTPWHEHEVEATGMVPAGVGFHRVAHGHGAMTMERLFRLAWQHEHKDRDLLGSLMAPYEREGLQLALYGPAQASSVTRRDREVAATVIQWLGTNVGRSFIRKVLVQDARDQRFLEVVEHFCLMNGRYSGASRSPRLAASRKKNKRAIGGAVWKE
jgi:hypothetical protein